MQRRPLVEARVLLPSEYPPAIVGPQALLVAQHPLGLYHVELHGAGGHAVYFTRARATRPKVIGSARDVAGALRIISEHEDELTRPATQRGASALERRADEARPRSRLGEELDAWLVARGT